MRERGCSEGYLAMVSKHESQIRQMGQLGRRSWRWSSSPREQVPLQWQQFLQWVQEAPKVALIWGTGCAPVVI